jgi:hypothetical protein
VLPALCNAARIKRFSFLRFQFNSAKWIRITGSGQQQTPEKRDVEWRKRVYL